MQLVVSLHPLPTIPDLLASQLPGEATTTHLWGAEWARSTFPQLTLCLQVPLAGSPFVCLSPVKEQSLHTDSVL